MGDIDDTKTLTDTQNTQSAADDSATDDQQSDSQTSSALTINQNCTLCGTCVALHEDVFEFAEDGTVRVKPGADLTGKNLDEIKAICPAGAIE